MGLVPLHSLARWMPRIVSSTADEIVDGVDVLSQDRPKFRRQGRSWRSQSRQHFVMLDLRRAARIDHFRSLKSTHTKNTICPWARKIASDIIHAEGVRFAGPIIRVADA